MMKLAKYLHDFENGNLPECDENILYILALTFGVPNVKPNLSNARFHYWSIHKSEYWAHVDKTIGRDWFNRAWVLQEAALAQKLLVVCGKESLLWEAFYRATWLRYQRDPQTANQLITNESWIAMQAIQTMRDMVRTKQQPPSLLELVWASRNHQSTDARDKIFALPGVTSLLWGKGPSEQLGFDIDYGRSKFDIYMDFTISMIKQCKDLRALATCQRIRAINSKHMAAWCPTGLPLMTESAYYIDKANGANL